MGTAGGYVNEEAAVKRLRTPPDRHELRGKTSWGPAPKHTALTSPDSTVQGTDSPSEKVPEIRTIPYRNTDRDIPNEKGRRLSSRRNQDGILVVAQPRRQCLFFVSFCTYFMLP